MEINVFWFRKDLRLEDNTGLAAALEGGLPVLPLFIFDPADTEEWLPDNPATGFIHENLLKINKSLRMHDSSLLARKGDPLTIWGELANSYRINTVFVNHDYEPYATRRDETIRSFLSGKGTGFKSYKDRVIFEKREITNSLGEPYTVFTPYSKKWLEKFASLKLSDTYGGQPGYLKADFPFPSLREPGYRESPGLIMPYNLSNIDEYDRYRDVPAAERTTLLGPHLRFGTVSIRKIASLAASKNMVFLKELIWREFFMQILFNFPHVVTENFRSKYNGIAWRNNENDFRKWCNGETGYPIVDAGMRQLAETGYMHNRVRMIVASFLCKHLLTDWRWGEAWFAEKLHDYELASNNGNWQWAAGTGCDASPWFRIFNPHLQQKKYDSEGEYIRKWAPDYLGKNHPPEIINHAEGRERAINVYRNGLLF